MKKIECYIQPYNLDTVAEALAVEGVLGMSVAEVKGFGVQKGFTRGEDVKSYEYRFHPKMKVEMVVPPVDDAVRTRTGVVDRGDEDLALADLVALERRLDGLHDALHVLLEDDHLDLHLGVEAVLIGLDVLAARESLLDTEALDLGDRHPQHALDGQRLGDRVEVVRLDVALDLLHRVTPFIPPSGCPCGEMDRYIRSPCRPEPTRGRNAAKRRWASLAQGQTTPWSSIESATLRKPAMLAPAT